MDRHGDATAGLSEAEVLRMAQSYLSRRAASVLQLRRVLARKLARRFDASQGERPEQATVEAVIDAVVERIVRAGLVDDAALVQSRADTLIRKGLARHVIRRRLAQQGFDGIDQVIEAVVPVDDEDQARRFAQRKRLGPWRSGRRPADPERDLRSMVRAGFSSSLARRVLQEAAGLDDP